MKKQLLYKRQRTRPLIYRIRRAHRRLRRQFEITAKLAKHGPESEYLAQMEIQAGMADHMFSLIDRRFPDELIQDIRRICKFKN